MIYHERPENFAPKFDVVSCFFEHDGKILLLLRQDHKPQGNTWGVPAGKVENGETVATAMIRELEEETGVKTTPNLIRFAHMVFVRYPEYDFNYHIFHLSSAEEIFVNIDPSAHKKFAWVTPREALEMELIQDEDACINLCYKNKLA